MAPFRTKARRLWAGAALAGTGLAAALLSAGGASAGDPPDPLGEKTGGDTTVYATGRNAFSFPAANLEDAERTRFVIGNSFFKRNWVEAGASTRARDGLGPHFIARSCGGCHVQDGRGEPPEIFNRLGETRDPIVSLLIRLSIPGTDPHGGPRPEPVYGDQLNTAAVQGVKPEGTVTLRYETVQGRFADGTPYTLLKPHYGVRDLGYGPLHAGTMLSPRIAPQVIGVGLLEAIAEADILANAAGQAGRAGPDQGATQPRLGRTVGPQDAGPLRLEGQRSHAGAPDGRRVRRRHGHHVPALSQRALHHHAGGLQRIAQRPARARAARKAWRSTTRPSTTWSSTRPRWPLPRAAT